MKKNILLMLIIVLLPTMQTWAQIQKQLQESEVDYPWVPRISAYEAYIEYKAGKTIILNAGGEAFSRRHILGSLNFNVKPRNHLINKLPKQGIEIFTYCY